MNLQPTVPENYGPAGTGLEQLPPEIHQLLAAHPQWGFFPAREHPGWGIPGFSPPFVGPLQAVPAREEWEQKTELKHNYQVRLLQMQNEEHRQEFVKILQNCAEGHYVMECCMHRWDDQGLWFFLCYDVPVRMARAVRQPVLPVSPR